MTGALKGLYVVRLNLDDPYAMGATNKIRAQARVLADALGQVDLYYTADAAVMHDGAVVKRAGSGRLGRVLLHAWTFYATVAKDRRPYDFVYIRYQRASLALLWMLARMRARRPRPVIVVEMPSFPYHSEYRSFRQRLLGLSDLLWRRYLGRHVDRIITFSRLPAILGIPTIRTDNGTDVASIPLLPMPASDQEIRLVGVAGLSFWHGYDRVIAGLAAYRKGGGSRRVAFDVVGTGPELERLKQDVARLDLSDLVTFHGPKQGAALDAVMDGRHVGISSIGMHRLVTDTSNLKSREFCARGLPFVIGYPDRDFEADFPFCFHAPATDDPLDIGAVASFYDGLRKAAPDYPRQMRRYAEERLTWEAKLAPVVAYIHEAGQR